MQNDKLPHPDVTQDLGAEKDAAAAVRRAGGTRRAKSYWYVRGPALALLLLPFVMVAGIFLRLQAGPIEGDFIREQVTEALERMSGGALDIAVAQARIVQRGHRISLELEDVQVRDIKGRSLLHAPRSAIAFDPLTMARGNMLPDRVTLAGTRLNLVIDEQGHLLLQGDGAAPDAAAGIADPLAAIAQLARGETASRELSRFVLTGGTLVVTDRRSGFSRTYDGVSLGFASGAGKEATLRLDGDRSGNRLALTITARAIDADRTAIALTMTGLGQDELALTFGLKDLPLSIATAVTVSAQAEWTGTQWESASVVVNSGPGVVSLPEWPAETFRHDRAELAARWSRADGLIVLDRAAWMEGNTSFALRGILTPVANSAGSLWDISIGGTDGKLGGVTADDETIAISTAVAKGRLDLAGKTISLTDVALRGQGVHVDGSVKASVDEMGALGLELRISGSELPVRHALRLWPRFAVPEAHDYLARHALAGQLTSVQAVIAMPPAVMALAVQKLPVPADAVRIDFDVRDGSLAFLDKAPPISGLSATGFVTGREIAVNAPRAFLELRPGKRMTLSDGMFALPDLTRSVPDAKLAVRAQGPADVGFEFLSLPAFAGAVPKLPPPAAVKGTIDSRATIAFPVSPTLKPQDIQTSVTANLSGFSLEKAFGKERLDNANLQVQSDRNGLVIKGEGRLLSQPVSIEVTRGVTPRRGGRDDAAILQFVMDDAARAKQGLTLGKKVTGPVNVRIVAGLEDPEKLSGEIEIDLTRAALDGLLPNLVKAAGRPAKLTADIDQSETGFALTNLAFDAGTVSLRGALQLGLDGQFQNARLSNVRLSPGDNVKIDADRGKDGGARIVVRGNNFDARPLLKGSKPGEARDPTALQDFELDLKTNLLSGFNREVLTNADIKLVRKGGVTRQQAISGRFAGAALDVRGAANGATTVVAEDAGALLRYLDIYPRMIGGRMDATLSGTGEQQGGTLMVRDFVLRDEPALKRLLAAPQAAPSTNDDASRQFVAISADDASRFTKMRVDFERDGARYEIKDAVIWGDQIGMTVSGRIDTLVDRIALNGTFIPAYALNNVFARIPVLGDLLGGNQYEGLLGITFRVNGRTAAPVVTVSPISALAPGIFRRLFEFRQNPSAAPADTGSNR